MTSPPRYFRPPHGLTLVELCVVIAIAALLAASAAPTMQALIDGRRLDGAATQLATDLQLVRSEAVARNQPLRLTLQADPAGSCYVIHTGDAGDCRCGGPGPARCHAPALAIKTTLLPVSERVSLSWNASSLLFDPLHGTSTPTATLRVIGAHGREVRHVVNVMGRVRSCSPSAAAPGYRAC